MWCGLRFVNAATTSEPKAETELAAAAKTAGVAAVWAAMSVAESGKQSGGEEKESGSQGVQGYGADTKIESSGASLDTDYDTEQYCAGEPKGKDEVVVGIACGFALFE